MESLKNISAKTTAKEVEKSPEDFVSALKDAPHDYLKEIFKNIGYITLDKFAQSGFYEGVLDSSILNGINTTRFQF